MDSNSVQERFFLTNSKERIEDKFKIFDLKPEMEQFVRDKK